MEGNRIRLQHEVLKKKEWPDYNIDDWPVKEIIKTAIRKDGYV